MEEKQDPILEEFRFCPECEHKVLILIDYIRNLESAQIVAKEALMALESANKKLTVERKMMEKEREHYRDLANRRSQTELEKRIESIDNAHQRFVNRGKF